MFTGLIEEVGVVHSIAATNNAGRLQLEAPRLGGELHPGDSLAVNGCCLTVTAQTDGLLAFDLLAETLARTNFAAVQRGTQVNLERALRADAPLGGHFVQGHVDCTASICAFIQSGADFRLEIALADDRSRYLVEKGSIAIDGISLTVAEVNAAGFVTWIIPHTRAHTNLQAARAGTLVNLEFDILAKYVEGLLARTTGRGKGESPSAR